MLHIHNGDSSADTARRSSLPGENFAFREALIAGPTPSGLSQSEWRQVRAQHLSESYGVELQKCERELSDQEAKLATFSEHEEVVLWFEHDLFCQVHLIYLLNWFGHRQLGQLFNFDDVRIIQSELQSTKNKEPSTEFQHLPFSIHPLMDVESIRSFCLSLPHVDEKVAWENDLLFRIGGKMFAVVALEPSHGVLLSFKCAPEKFAELVEQDGIIPAPYVARYHWVAFERFDALPERELKDLLKNAYQLVHDKLPKKIRDGLGSNPASDAAATKGRKKR